MSGYETNAQSIENFSIVNPSKEKHNTQEEIENMIRIEKLNAQEEIETNRRKQNDEGNNDYDKQENSPDIVRLTRGRRGGRKSKKSRRNKSKKSKRSTKKSKRRKH